MWDLFLNLGYHVATKYCNHSLSVSRTLTQSSYREACFDLPGECINCTFLPDSFIYNNKQNSSCDTRLL